MTKIYNKLLDFLKKENCKIDKEVEFFADQLSEIVQLKEDDKRIDGILKWLEEKRKNYNVKAKEVGINELENWEVDPKSGNIYHKSREFFSVVGIKVTGADDREVSSWTQPMIKQKGCGILGILSKKIDGVRHYLLQAKYEPGNTGKLQLSPTLQATESNLLRVHKGKKPLFAEYFKEEGKGKVLVSVESIEDGGRFYLKTNTNMIVEIEPGEEIKIPDSFIWLNICQLKRLLKEDCVINSLTRNILGSI
ncbi:NDP-hexose 2,3-dehydratase family protein [archaeon AH-315-M20]|nr:NDP-hexose 2,3-dehydratase family protein [archaeon AH-315-M20]